MVRLAGAFVAATVTTVVLSGCGGGGDGTTTTQKPTPKVTTTQQPTPKATKSIAELAKATKDLSTLYTAWTASNVSAKLKNPPYTVFAPTNAAFDALDKDTLQCLLTSVGKASLMQVIENHVVEGAAVAADLKNDQELTTLEGDQVKVSIEGSTVKVGAATVVEADIMATDGVIHEIDKVLVPEKSEKFEVPQCGSCGSIGACAASSAKKDPPEGATLVAALTAAGLVSALTNETALLTVFAPTDAAFAAADADGLVTCLLKPENKDTLTAVLEYHVVPGYVLAADVTDKLTADTLDGKNKLTFGVSKGVVTVIGGAADNIATVTAPNLFANNGVTHVIDKVLIPKGFTPPSCATTTTTAKMTTTTTKKITQNQIQV